RGREPRGTPGKSEKSRNPHPTCGPPSEETVRNSNGRLRANSGREPREKVTILRKKFSPPVEVACSWSSPALSSNFAVEGGHACAPWIGRSRGKPSTSIQDISGLPQGPARPCVLGLGCGEPAARGGEKPHVSHETARVHHASRRGSRVAARGARAAGADAGDRFPPPRFARTERTSRDGIPQRIGRNGLY